MQGGNLSIPARIIEKSEEKLANFSKMPYLCRRIFTILLNRYGNNKKKKDTRRGSCSIQGIPTQKERMD